MMLRYSNEQLATIIGVPIVTVLLIWTVAIFHKNRKKWSSYDIAVVAILVHSILRNLTVLAYTALIIAKQGFIPGDYCKAVAWTFNSLHTFQASSLTTLAVIALFTVKLYRKQQNLQQYLTATHVIYHLFCLTTLCACVGVASILAQEDNSNNDINFSTYEENAPCKFMPFELDVKFNIFIIVLHIFLAMVSFTAFIFICFNHFGLRRQGFDYLKKSTSDLSELSLSLTASLNDNANANANKSYYDTYTIQRLPHLDQFDNYQHHPPWNSDLSNISMTVSSTNSKRPCLKKAQREEEDTSCGLHTMYPILTVCYLFNHLPLILLCIFPRLIAPWTVSGVALWMGQLQDVLVPIGLGLVDSRFCEWVSRVYKCAERRKEGDKIPPGVGLDGKFRHFGSQPQSLEITQTYQVPKFPITNGSLYTSIDGRLPIIHNYRRQKGGVKTIPNSLNLHSTHLKRQEYVRQRYALEQDACGKCETKLLNKRISLSEDSLCRLSPILSKDVNRPRLVKKKRNKLSLGRISKSHDCLNDLQVDLNKFRQNPEVFEKKRSTQSVSSDDEYFSDTVNVQDFDATSQSSFSITTEANCDFEFYQNKSVDLFKPEKKIFVDEVAPRQLRITRSNSKRSLENFQAYVSEESSFNRIQRSNSYVDDCKNNVKYLQDMYNKKTKPCGGSVPDFKRVFISEYI